MDVSTRTFAPHPSRILIIRPDAYGDIVLFEPVLRWLRAGLPGTQVAVIVRESYLDIARLLPEGVSWIGSGCDPYRYGPDAPEVQQSLAQLRDQLVNFEPDCVVAACYSKTWFEAVVASWFPASRQISLGPYELDLVSACILKESWPEARPDLFTESIGAPWDLADWQKNVSLAKALLGRPLSLNPLPQIGVPDGADQWARHKIAELGLAESEYVACCPAGTATISIKAWPAESFATVLTQLAAKHGVQPLLMGSHRELPVLGKVGHLAAEMGLRKVAIWTGEGGDIDHLAALLRLARLYVGNDSGAMHLAAALNKRGVAVFGGGHWPRFRPAGNGFVTVVQPLPCFGCRWHCVFGNAPCVCRIPAEEVFAAVERVIQGPAVAEGELREVPWMITDEEASLALSWSAQRVDEQRQMDATSVSQILRELRKSEADRATRLEVIERQGKELGRIHQLEADKAHLIGRLEESEADRAARLEVIERQGKELGRIHQLEADKAHLIGRLEETEKERKALCNSKWVRVGLRLGLVSTKTV
jgi:ADP-heptose:LPS heptosyltransferase